MDLLVFEKKINKMKLSELTDEHYVELKKIIFEMDPEERQKQYERIAEVFFKVLSLTDYELVKEPQINIIIELCDIIAVSEIDYNKGSYAFIKFLYFLKSDKQFSFYKNDSDLLQQYSLFGDIIDQVSWVFSIKKGGEIVFPLRELLSKLAVDFECNNESLVRLAIALQLFSLANEWIQLPDNDDTRKRIKDIAEKYNIRFLQYLIKGGRLSIKSNENYIKNGTMIFQLGNSVLIRNTSRAYFDEDCDYEKDDSNNPIAYFVESTKPEKGTLTNFVEILGRENEYQLKLEILDEVFRTKNFNILYDNLIFVDNNSSKFLGFLNIFGKNDKYIVYKDNKLSCDLSNFLFMLKHHVNNIRGSILYKNKMDILTLDFLISIFDFLPNEVSFSLTSICNDKHEDFFQNLIIKKCFEKVKKKSKDKYSYMLFKYSSYFSNYLAEINLDTNMTDVKALIMPYRLYFDFENIESFYEFEKERIFDETQSNKIVWKTIKYEEFPRPTFLIAETENTVELRNFEENRIGSFSAGKTIECFIDTEKNVAYYDQDLYMSYKEINRLFEWNKKSKLIYQDFRDIDDNDLSKTAQIIDLIKLTIENYRPFNLEREEGKKLVIPYYKLLWHFALHRWGFDDVKSFFELVLRKHYTDSVLCYKNCFTVFEEIEKSDSSILYVAKESLANQGTLYLLYLEFIRQYGTRYHLGYMFDADMIKNNLKELSDGYYFKSKKIEKIVIVSDMLMNGKAMIDALKFYLRTVPNEIKKFVKINDEIKSILNKNSAVKIEVISLWGFKSSIANIKNEFSDLNISVKIINVIHEQYRCDSTTQSIISNLYNDSKKTGLCCAFRYNNMPACSVFPDYVLNTTKIGGIFNRKNEVK